MNGSFDSETRNFGELLGQYEKRQIIVPQFQRGYSWESTHVSAFWRDLLEFQNQTYTIRSEKYFLGPIVILPDSQTNTILLLDGQQRLATATILFSVLRDTARGIANSVKLNDALVVKANNLAHNIHQGLIEKDEDKNIFSLKLGELDNEFFYKFVQKDPTDKVKPSLRSHMLIRSARDFLASMVQKELEDLAPDESMVRIKKIKDTLATDITMVAISVKTEDDAFRIFETLNDRGLRLSVPDLVLNYLMRTACNDQEKYRVRDRWNFMLDKMGRRDIDRFLRHMWLSKYGDVKARGLFSEIKDFLRDNKIHSVDFADTCAEECEQYVAIIEADKTTLGDAYDHIVSLVKYLEITSSYPLLLSGLRSLSLSDFERLAHMALDLAIRHSVLANLDPSNLESAFYLAAREIRNCKQSGDSSAKCLQVAKKHLASINPQNNQIHSRVQNVTLTKRQAQYILAKVANRIQSTTNEIGVDNANLEHIFPLHPADDWGDTTELVPLTWHIGNLTILGKRLNEQAANAKYEVKASKCYSKSEIRMTSEIPLKYTRWTPQEILGRAQELAPLITKIWVGP